MCQLIVPQIHHLQPLGTGQSCTQPSKALLIKPNAIPLQRQAGDAAVQAEKSSKQNRCVSTYVVPFKVHRFDRGVLSKALKNMVRYLISNSLSDLYDNL